MTRITTSALTALCVATLACAGETGERTTMQGGEATGPRTVALTAVGSSGITGDVTLEASGDSTTITLALSGGTAGADHPAHVHQQTCDHFGPVVVPLTSVAAGEDGTGSSTTTVATTTLDQARQSAGAILVMAHLPDGTPAACAGI